MTHALPPPVQVAGKHAPLFEAFYYQLDPAGKGVIPALDGAKFLKRSGLSDAILSKIWDLADPTGKGFLDKSGLFVSLKLIALAQNGREVDVRSVMMDTPEPQMGERPPPAPVLSSSDAMWSLSVPEVEKFASLFRQLESGGKIGGVQAKNIMIESKLPVETLGKVWDMADADKDGALDLTEFVCCLGLLARAVKEGGVVPNTLPKLPVTSVAPPPVPPPVAAPPLIPPAVPAMHAVPPPVPPPVSSTTIPRPQIGGGASVLPPLSASPLPITSDWVITPEEFAKYSLLFTQSDKDRDGFVSGLEIRDVFLQSGIPQQILAHIWNLCDTDQSGKLSQEQFALAMYFISRKLSGLDPPQSLAPNMIPPSMRPGGASVVQATAAIQAEMNPEFELIMKEIMELRREREAIENEISTKETDKKIKSGEMKSLQTEFDTLAATLKQLENQKGVASAKLGELAAQVDTLKTQADSQEETLKVQEGEVNEKLAEFNSLNEEESSIERETKESQETIEKIVVSLQEAQLSISQAKTKITSLSELQENMDKLVKKFGDVIESGNVYSITEPELMDLAGELHELLGEPDEPVPAEFIAPEHAFPTSNDDPFANFSNDKFSSSVTPSSAFPQQTDEDPFAALHAPPPLSASSPWSHPDPFAPISSASKHDASPGARDSFGHEPFSNKDDGPALPPKPKGAGKAPPPRPAPPKNAPARPPPPKVAPSPVHTSTSQNFSDAFSQGDPFGGNDGDQGGFADFSNFDQHFDNSTSSQSSGFISSSPWESLSSKSNFGTGSSSTPPAFSTIKSLDFTEDPFKNYRYEDPFALADPFQSLAGDPFQPQNDTQQSFQSNINFGSHSNGGKSIANNNNGSHFSNSNKNAHHKNGFM